MFKKDLCYCHPKTLMIALLGYQFDKHHLQNCHIATHNLLFDIVCMTCGFHKNYIPINLLMSL